MTRKEHEKALKLAHEARQAIEREQWTKKCEFEKELSGLFDERIYAARAIEREHQQAIEDSDNEEALAKAKPPYPEGTLLQEWKAASRFSLSENRTYVMGALRGRVEVVKPGAASPSNLAGYTKPRVGAVIIRRVKVDHE